MVSRLYVRFMFFRRLKIFLDDRETVEDEFYLGQPVTSKTEDNIAERQLSFYLIDVWQWQWSVIN